MGWSKNFTNFLNAPPPERPVCPHGIKEGDTKGFCHYCVAPQKRIAEEKQAAQEPRTEDAGFAAEGLRRRERWRLSEILLPRIEELRALNWREFENQIAKMFERLGFVVEQTPFSNDHGRDGILWKDGNKYLYECKKYQRDKGCGRPDLQKFHSALHTDKAVAGYFVTTGRFSSDAVEFAEEVGNIELVYGNELTAMMLKSKPNVIPDDTYRSLCPKCEAIVHHRLRSPKAVTCPNGHRVAPTLDIESVIAVAGHPDRYASP